MVTVTRINDNEYEVTVDAKTKTSHRVTLTDDYYQKLAGGKATPEELIEHSFQFLLEREPNTSILRSFELPVIATYFPEYESVMQSRYA